MAEFLEYLAFLALAGIAGVLPVQAVRAVGASLGSAAFHLTRVRHRVTLDNLTHAFPGRSSGELRGIARGAYRNYGIAVMEMLWAGSATEDRLLRTMRLANPEVPAEALARGKGLILMSAHYGSWELILNAVQLHLGQPFVAVAQHQSNGWIDRFIDARRRRFGNTMIPMGPSVREVLSALREGKIVIMLGDQSGPKESVFVTFFGRPAATHRGAAAFSLRTGAPIVMMFIIRQPDGNYVTIFEEVDQTGLSGSSDQTINELTRRHTALLEKYIRLHPDHWLWMHKRWKHTPYFESHHQGQVSE